MPDDTDGDEGEENGENGCEQAEIEIVVADRSKCVSVRAAGSEDETAADLAQIVREALGDADMRANRGEREERERCFQ